MRLKKQQKIKPSPNSKTKIMNVIINGTKKEFLKPITLTELVGQYCSNPKHVIAEVNGQIIHASLWSKNTISDGDSIELVTFVGGG